MSSLLPHLLAFATLAEDSGGPSSHDLLIGTIVTALVTLFLGILANYGTRSRRADPVPIPSPAPPDVDDEIVWLRGEVARLQNGAELASDTQRGLYEEIDKFKDMLRDNGVNWRTGRRINTHEAR